MFHRVAVVVVAAGGCLVAAGPDPGNLAADLASPDYRTRERASDALWRQGDAARPALDAALKGADPEAAVRAAAVLARFDAGDLPDLTPAVRAAVTEFRAGPGRGRLVAVNTLVRAGAAGLPVLKVLLARTTGKDRAAVFDHLTWLLRRDVPTLIETGDLDRAEKLLAVAAAGPGTAGAADYALILHLRGRAGAVLPTLPAESGTAADPSPVAVFVAHATGDRAAARAAAGRVAEFAGLDDALLEDAGDWATLAGRPVVGPVNSADGLTAARLRWAGRPVDAAKILDPLVTAPPADADWLAAVDPASLALFLNDRPADGIVRLAATGTAPHILSDIRAARLDFAAALTALTPKPPDPDAAGGPVAVTPAARAVALARRGRVLAMTGDGVESGKAFVAAAEALGPTPATDTGMTQVVRAMARSGRSDLGCDCVGRALAADRAQHRTAPPAPQAFEVLFDADADSAMALWAALTRADAPPDAGAASLRLVERLLTGRGTRAEVEAALAAVRAERAKADDRLLVRAAAAVLRAADRPAEALAELETAADARPPAPPEVAPGGAGRARAWVYGTEDGYRFWVELAELLTDAGRDRAAADRLVQGWHEDPANPVPLYLSGRALERAGDAAGGRRRVERSHWVALGDGRQRGRFLQELCDRGCLAAAGRETPLARLATWPADRYAGNVWNQVSRAAGLTGDFSGAVATGRRAVSYILKMPRYAYVEGQAYLVAPAGVAALEARGLLAAGKPGPARAAADGCLAEVPGNVEFAGQIAREFDAAGRPADADAVFRAVADAYARVLREYPQSAWAKANAAQVRAGCRRELAAGLTLAREAVAADPTIDGHRETLAELLFRTGDRAGAVAEVEKLLAADRRNISYRRHLAFYRTGDPAAALPPAD